MILLDDWCQRSLITISGFFIPGRDMTALFYSPAEIKHWKTKGQLSGEKSWRVTSTTTSCQRSCDYSDSWGALLNECSLRLLSRPSLLKILGMIPDGSPDGRCPAPSQRLFGLVACCRPEKEYRATWHLNIRLWVSRSNLLRSVRWYWRMIVPCRC